MARSACLFALALGGCVVNNPSYVAPPPIAVPATLQIQLNNVNGVSVGGASLWETPKGVFMRVSTSGLTGTGWHAIHFHEHGDCSGANFAGAGAHVGHETGRHGLLNPLGPEAGDLPNFAAPTAEIPMLEIYAPNVTLGGVAQGARAPLRDSDGSALVIHANADDHLSQPIGGAGDRIACAIIPPAG